jgi:NitT/TauT family transport system substrate-binding protein
MLGIGIFVTKETAAKRPQLVRGFLAATARGVQEAMDDPQAAVAAVVKLRPEVDPQFLLEGVTKIPAHIRTKNSANFPLLAMAKPDWDETRNNLINYLEMPRALESEAFYTNDFLPTR